jgi:hypothetical protein
MTELSGWENFYVIVGSSAGALIGLQFVVLTLIADRVAGQERAGQAFSTPTIVHFGAALLLAATVSAPWHAVGGAAMVWGILGFSGMIYETVVAHRMRTQTAYKPQLEDWMFHLVLPFAAYALLAGSAYEVRFRAHDSMFVTAAAALLLLFVGIHNAWDAVTYHIYFVRKRQPEQER